MHETAAHPGPEADRPLGATQGATTLDELDLALVNALQLAPRAPWSQLAGPLGVDAATLSRRWSRLRDSGAAWVTCYSAAGQVVFGSLAFVEVNCAPQARERLAARLAGHPHAVSVELVAGSCDLLLTVAAASTRMMSEYVLSLARDPDITGTRTHLVQRLHQEGSQWRLDALSREQQRGLEHDTTGSADRIVTPDERALMLALAEDGRRPVATLAALLGRPESTVRRLLAGVLGGGKAVLRCEAAHLHAGWRTTATLWMAAPPTELEAAAEELTQLRDTRLSASVASEANLVGVVWMHGMDDLSRYEARVGAKFPALRVLNRAVTLRWIKRMGRLLDGEGRSVGCVPMDVWQPVSAT
ncbi:Lrp/AsnC family transcriptional regulator [Streptomyces endophyticus]|uniref:Lrp/AsnC family transcriptional regulator n=1 Tax=Streptomyces endophyticus TaxID=714166 RepID=A0ABU6FAC2_9ACTN|nr:AsnC family transcriptional regulator [Streptomyces endophyticus]MEB8340789.1 Lrp/AsnC family transcriptional regulator [Streptomyces endophyticus]